MNQLFAFWAHPSNSGNLFMWIIITLVIGFALIFGMMQLPAQARRPITIGVTFLAGLFYVLLWLWPQPQDRAADDIPNGPVETVGFWFNDAVSEVANLSTIITAMLLLLGVFSLVRIHVIKLAKQQKDWFFSACLLVAFFSMVLFGYWDWLQMLDPVAAQRLENPENWRLAQKGRNLLFDGMLQAMDAAMFSIIAFYILSAAYRAFRIRSVEATILLASALFMMLSLLALVDKFWSDQIKNMTQGDQGHFMNSYTLGEIAGFIRRSFQSPSLRAIDFGIGIGALAMGLRLWLGLEKGGVSN